MKRWTKLLTIPIAMFLLVACGNDDQETTHAEGEESVEVANSTIDTASNEADFCSKLVSS